MRDDISVDYPQLKKQYVTHFFPSGRGSIEPTQEANMNIYFMKVHYLYKDVKPKYTKHEISSAFRIVGNY